MVGKSFGIGEGDGIDNSGRRDYAEYTLYNLSEILDQFYSAAFVIDVFTYVFVIMISLIAVANVFNTISTNIRLRRRELAMLRSVGMSGRDFNKMILMSVFFTECGHFSPACRCLQPPHG